jgi:glycosyltransferase involved in cell wall biosynthesis
VRVLIDTTFVRRGPTGGGVYVERLVPALRAEGVDVVEAQNDRRRPPAGGGLGSLRNLASDVAWTQGRLRRHGADLVHHPMPAHIRHGRRPQVVTVHDVAYEVEPSWFDARYRSFATRALRRAAQRADVVICGTDVTRRDLERRWGLKRIVVAPYGPGQQVEVETRGDPRHFLYVGDAEPRKDVAALLAAHARYASRTAEPLPLVLVGSVTAHQPLVRLAGRVTTDELAALHAHAAALVHPSRHEGFGFTVAEALHAGTPVIAVRNDAIEEVVGGHALVVPAGDIDALADALANPPRPVRDRRHSWAACARAHIEAYSLAMST